MLAEFLSRIFNLNVSCMMCKGLSMVLSVVDVLM